MKIIDCTTYYSEDLMMDIRFHILNDHVDKFIVTESKYSHSGKLKPLNFDINNFPKFKDKIQYLVIENEPEGINKNPNNSSSIKRMNSLLRIEQSYNLVDKFEPKKYILRKIDTSISDIDIAKDKINQKKAQGATDDDW